MGVQLRGWLRTPLPSHIQSKQWVKLILKILSAKSSHQLGCRARKGFCFVFFVVFFFFGGGGGSAGLISELIIILKILLLLFYIGK